MADSALSGLVVLDLSENIAGPYCTKLLADYGATVIKIEKPTCGDASRRAGPFPSDNPNSEKSGLFLFLNTSKKSVSLDIEHNIGRDIFLKLVKQTDIVVENFKPGTMTKLGLNYEVLADINPKLIMTSISYFGQTGCYRDWNGADIVAQAMGGLMHLTGDPDRQPLKLPLSQAEFQAGLNAAVAILCAVYYRDVTSEGQYIDISLQEAIASIMEGVISTYSYSGQVLNRIGASHRYKCPSTIMKAKDCYVHIESGAYWEHFATLTEAPQLLEPRLASMLRYRHADEVEEAIRPWVQSHTAEEIFTEGQEWRMPVAKVMGIEELDSDPQYAARNYFQDFDHPQAGRLKYPGAPFKMSETPADINRAPLLGEHNDEIYTGFLGLSADELAGVRIIDLSQVFAGPYATKLLVDMGAEVIRIECAARSGRGGSLPRTQPGGDFGASFPDGDTGERSYNRFAYYNELNRNKYAITIDLSKPRGIAVFKRLVAISDVVVENFSPRVMRNFGLDYAALRETNPRIIMASISGYGQDGPYRDCVAYGEGIEAMSGMSKLTAYRNGTPLKPGVAYADAAAGLHAAFSIMAALRYRRVKGVGQYVDISMREALTPLLSEAIMDYSMNGKRPEPMGNRHAHMAPHGCYPTKGNDKWIAIAVSSDEEWQALCHIMSDPQWNSDERFADVAGRLEIQDEIDHLIGKWTIGYDHIELAEILQAHGIKAGAVLNAAELVDDPHLKARGFFEEVEHPEAGTHIIPGISWKMSRTAGRIERPAPCFGEHNRYVFSELLGMSDEEIEELARAVVTAEAPLPYTEI